MFKKHYQKRSPNILFVLFRTILSVVIFVVLLLGMYAAYKSFSGMDPLKIDPKALVLSLISSKSPSEALNKLLAVKLSTKSVPALSSDAEKVLGQNSLSVASTPSPVKKGPVAFKFMLVADSHNENDYLKKALTQGTPGVSFVIGLGDYTEVGTIEELVAAKKEFDQTGLRYFVIPGDHDLWDSRNRQQPPNSDFRQVFGPTYQSFDYQNFHFILLNNADNYLGMDGEQIDWLKNELQKAKDQNSTATYVFVHEPLYHPSSDHMMGRVEKKLQNQAREVAQMLKAGGVKEVFAGDVHFFTRYIDPENNLSMTTLGAVASQRNAQAPRFGVVTVYQDGSLDVEDVEIK